jgi:O-antigen/teichoic acid export membrane protein
MRHWKTLTASFATVSARLSSVAAMVLTNGIAGRSMTRDQYGLWTVLLIFNLVTNGFDLGFSMTLGNRLAALGARGPEAEVERRETFLSILFLEIAITTCLIGLVLVSFPFVPWQRVFKISDPILIAQVRRIMPIVMIFMVSTLPFALMNGVFYAYHEIKRASIVVALTSFAQVGVFALSVLWCRFTWVIILYFIANVALGVITTVYIFFHRKWAFSFLPFARIVATIQSLYRVSIHAFLLGLPAIISNVLGIFMSGVLFGLAAAGDFGNLLKLFSFLTTIHLSILSPISPAITLESHSGQWDSVRHRLRVCLLQLFPAFFLIAGCAVWYGHPLLIRLWIGRPFADYSLAGIMLLWACVAGFINTFSVFLNGMGLMKVQAAISLIMLIPSMILPYVFSRWFGPSGIAISMVLCALPFAIILPLYTRRALRLEMLRV